MRRLFISATATIVLALGLLAAAAAGVASPGGALRWPLLRFHITQPFGCTSVALEPRNSQCAQGHWHSGIDLAAAPGTPVTAANDGFARLYDEAGGYGLHLIVDSGNGLSTLYAHLSCTTVPDGAPVLAGAQIGCVGSTGNSSGPHLHFEVRRDDVPEDPVPLLPPIPAPASIKGGGGEN